MKNCSFKIRGFSISLCILRGAVPLQKGGGLDGPLAHIRADINGSSEPRAASLAQTKEWPGSLASHSGPRLGKLSSFREWVQVPTHSSQETQSMNSSEQGGNSLQVPAALASTAPEMERRPLGTALGYQNSKASSAGLRTAEREPTLTIPHRRNGVQTPAVSAYMCTKPVPLPRSRHEQRIPRHQTAPWARCSHTKEHNRKMRAE